MSHDVDPVRRTRGTTPATSAGTHPDPRIDPGAVAAPRHGPSPEREAPADVRDVVAEPPAIASTP